MKKDLTPIISKSDYEWIDKVDQYQLEKKWRIRAEKFSLAIMRILRLENKDRQELAKELNIDNELFTEILRGKVNLDLKTIAKIEEALHEDIIIVKNIDLSRKFQNCYFYYMEYENTINMEDARWEKIEDSRQFKRLEMHNYEIPKIMYKSPKEEEEVYEYQYVQI